jgi:SAM-dependent methyltransferase
VLDPGTGPGHHAIYYAAKGYAATGIDGSAAAIERARENARKAGVSVNFEVADAMKLEGLEGRFDTVVDCAFYHTFSTDPDLQRSYAQALHRSTRPGARLYMFEFGEHDVNGFKMPRSLSENDFRDVLPPAGWEITYLGPTTYLVNLSTEAIEMMAARNPDMAEQVQPMMERFKTMEPWLEGGRVHAPFWEVHATRVD